MDVTTSSGWKWALACLLVGRVLGESAKSTEFIEYPKSAAATDYCKICKNHIACNNTGKFDASCPPDVKLLELDTDDIRLYLHTHNKIRDKWASSEGNIKTNACRMATIRWDPELAELAKLQVKTCSSTYDKCHNTQRYTSSGQNLFYVGHWPAKHRMVIIFLQALEAWHNMGFFAKYHHLINYRTRRKKRALDLFALIVLEDNIAIGCAGLTFKEDPLIVYRVVCNYASNYRDGRPLYKTCRKPASKCTTGSNSLYPGLCSTNEDYSLN